MGDFRTLILRSENKELNRTNSVASLAKQRYLASVLKLEIIDYYFYLHERRLPTKINTITGCRLTVIKEGSPIENSKTMNIDKSTGL